MPQTPIPIINTPTRPKISALMGRDKNLKDRNATTGRYQVSGVLRYISRTTTANPRPINMEPRIISNPHLFTPIPGVNQRKNRIN